MAEWFDGTPDYIIDKWVPARYPGCGDLICGLAGEGWSWCPLPLSHSGICVFTEYWPGSPHAGRRNWRIRFLGWLALARK